MSDEIDRWVIYMKQHPNTWKREHTQFINAQFNKHEQILRRLQATPEGKEKIKVLYDISNVNGYPSLF